jgi:hypothetical protein
VYFSTASWTFTLSHCPRNAETDLSSPVGRDKLLRTLQYFSRFLAWYLYRTNRPQASIAPFDAVKKQFSVTRKLMRVGKFVEHFKAAAIASDAKALDPVLRYCAVGRQLGYAGYMLLDNATVVCDISFGHMVGGEMRIWKRKISDNSDLEIARCISSIPFRFALLLSCTPYALVPPL